MRLLIILKPLTHCKSELNQKPSCLGKHLLLWCVLSAGGLILDRTVSDPRFEGMAVFTPIINGKCTITGLLFP